ncbi:hypothetical protein T07_12481 [Trichinella nelsoni]|uniref:Uncharacterized protein n=1 Tax=Trichinella nelsoni TaxID=6336 RepID=A0A0V0RV96_9BILA|nr:hypothetical protein T07_12481 [Trichinella nelsoni]
MSKQLKSATFQLIILAAIFYRALRLSIAFQFAFLNDELRQIHVVYKFEFTTIPLFSLLTLYCDIIYLSIESNFEEL